MSVAPALEELLTVMARLRSPTGCPWDREQDHASLRWHAVEEVYELLDAIEAGDDQEMVEELGDLLLQVVFHAQLGAERGAFDFGRITRTLTEKLIRRHPHVFGDTEAGTVDAVWTQWDKIKQAEKQGTRHERPSALDGVPGHLPALLRAEKLLKKARKAGLLTAPGESAAAPTAPADRTELGARLFELTRLAGEQGWSAEDLLRGEVARRERGWRKLERERVPPAAAAGPQPTGRPGRRPKNQNE